MVDHGSTTKFGIVRVSMGKQNYTMLIFNASLHIKQFHYNIITVWTIEFNNKQRLPAEPSVFPLRRADYRSRTTVAAATNDDNDDKQWRATTVKRHSFSDPEGFQPSESQYPLLLRSSISKQYSSSSWLVNHLQHRWWKICWSTFNRSLCTPSYIYCWRLAHFTCTMSCRHRLLAFVFSQPVSWKPLLSFLLSAILTCWQSWRWIINTPSSLTHIHIIAIRPPRIGW